MSAESYPAASPGWIRPGDVMRVRKLKAKSRALQARMKSSAAPLQILAPVNGQYSAANSHSLKRRNPFRCSPNKILRVHGEDNDLEATSDITLFQLLNPAAVNTKDRVPQTFSFSNLFSKEFGAEATGEDKDSPRVTWTDKLVVDWSLKTRIRFKSHKSLPWKHNFKTSEEASGTTGFVRCLSSVSDENDDRTLDTSANAQFYQCCLVWQHPNLPWLQLFPRDNIKLTSQTGLFGTDQKLAESLHSEWSESLRSLHQLLRVRQCPYFYVCGPTFTCLFRAAGVAGISQAHALITPTTRGFREAMKQEDIEFEMPFQNSGPVKTNASYSEDMDKDVEDRQKGLQEEDEDEEEEEEREEATSWLENLGVETSQFPNLNPNRVKLERDKYKNVDNTPSSLVYVEGMETQGLINFLLNSKSCVSTTGSLAGVPPTLLAPVAFQGATLTTLKAKGGVVRQDGDVQNSMEVSGPVLPHTVQQLTSLLSMAVDNFSVSLHSVPSTLPFSQHSHHETMAAPQAFAQEGLVDCGLSATVRHLICVPHKSEGESKLPLTYKEITFKENKFSWTDRLQ
ncbi:protein downstream neighbor of son homolog isoform X2 [Homarus americanus]|nr:protein downstream neighbor of son homolog isoform X2 [Homarus americanus]